MLKRLAPIFPILLALMPFDSGAAQVMNGFDISDSLVPADEILAGGPPRDGIPAIDRPRFLPADNAQEISPNEQVLGIELNAVAKAYPLGIMNWHEIVNDHFHDSAVVVTYCPLCGTGMAFYANPGGRDLDFGVSGLLYNSDVLLYDRATQSLWSQLNRRAISGHYKGKRLQPVPMEQTTWQDWLSRHPNTLLLSRETGYDRNYEQSPYVGYAESSALYFPVRFRTQGYHPKERVLGVEIDGYFKAYPFSELSRSGPRLHDQVGQQQILVLFEAEHQNARVEDGHGNTLPSVVAYWFAWYAFHPDTEIYRIGERE